MATDDKEMMALYHGVFTSPDGELVLKDLEEVWYDVLPYQAGADQNVNDTIFYEGARTVVAYIKDQIHLHEHGLLPKVEHSGPFHGDYL